MGLIISRPNHLSDLVGNTIRGAWLKVVEVKRLTFRQVCWGRDDVPAGLTDPLGEPC